MLDQSNVLNLSNQYCPDLAATCAGGTRTAGRPGDARLGLSEAGRARPSFLLESVTGGEQLARYSFIGVHPSRAYVLRSGQIDRMPCGGETEALDLPPGWIRSTACALS